MNEYRFYGKTDPTSGDSDYDHIVPIFGIESESADKITYYPNDQLIFSDNGLWNSHGHIDNFVFQYGFDAIQKSRVQANARTGSIYSLNNNGTNYGISISGVIDLDGSTILVRCTTSTDRELPEMQEGATDQPASSPLTITANVSIPDESVAYNLYMYNDFLKVPTSSFNAGSANSTRTWTIPAGSGSTFSVSVDMQSHETAVFRAVRITAP